MTSQDLRVAVRSGRRVYGTLLVSPSPHWVKVIAGRGLDFLFIDTEHIPIDRSMLAWMCQTYRALGLPPIVRVPSPDPYAACMVLDGGAAGIMVPYVETVEQVRALVGAVKFRPLKGRRLERALAGEPLEPELAAYLDKFNGGCTLLINIESVPAMDNLEALVAVPGVDGVVIGPHDLSLSLGVPEQYQHPKFDAAMRDIVTRARKAGVGAGFHYSSGLQQEIAWAKAGGNILIHSSDIVLFADSIERELREYRAAFGDGGASGGYSVAI